MIIKSPQAEERTRLELMGYRFHKKPGKLELKKRKREKVKQLKDEKQRGIKIRLKIKEMEEEKKIEDRILSKGW